MDGFSISGSITYGWNTFNERRGTCLAAGAVILGIMLGWDAVSEAVKHVDNFGLTLACFLVGFVGSVLLSMGQIHFALRAHDAPHEVKLVDLWAPQHFWNYLGAGIVSTIFVLLGFCLLIIPGIIFALMVMFATYLVVDEGRTPIASLKESMRITRGHRWKLLGFLIVAAGINVLGFIALIVGLIVTIPVTLISTAYVYRSLQQGKL